MPNRNEWGLELSDRWTDFLTTTRCKLTAHKVLSPDVKAAKMRLAKANKKEYILKVVATK